MGLRSGVPSEWATETCRTWVGFPRLPWHIRVIAGDQLSQNVSIPSRTARALAPEPPLGYWESFSRKEEPAPVLLWEADRLLHPSIISGVGFLIRFILNGSEKYF